MWLGGWERVRPKASMFVSVLNHYMGPDLNANESGSNGYGRISMLMRPGLNQCLWPSLNANVAGSQR